jgi:hypothetical protein
VKFYTAKEENAMLKQISISQQALLTAVRMEALKTNSGSSIGVSPEIFRSFEDQLNILFWINSEVPDSDRLPDSYLDNIVDSLCMELSNLPKLKRPLPLLTVEADNLRRIDIKMPARKRYFSPWFETTTRKGVRPYSDFKMLFKMCPPIS